MISEAASEKPKRGRPRVIDHIVRATFEGYGLYGEIRTERGRQNYHRMTRAMSVLIADSDAAEYPESYRWLMDKARMDRNERGAWQPGILAELGRIEDDDRLREVAMFICERKPKAKDGIAIIRRYRLGRDGVGDALGLANELIGRVNDYLKRYPNTESSAILAAIRTAQVQVEAALATD